jgi:predicted ArsR family transcriptional regulator
MTVDDLPADVERLLLNDLESYEQLETLLLLVAEPGQSRGADDVSRKLGITEEAAREALDRLREHGLVALGAAAGRPLYRYETPSPDRDRAVRSLARVYEEKPSAVAKRMTANAIERVRTAALRTFSEAFLVKKRTKDDG